MIGVLVRRRRADRHQLSERVEQADGDKLDVDAFLDLLRQ